MPGTDIDNFLFLFSSLTASPSVYFFLDEQRVIVFFLYFRFVVVLVICFCFPHCSSYTFLHFSVTAVVVFVFNAFRLYFYFIMCLYTFTLSAVLCSLFFAHCFHNTFTLSFALHSFIAFIYLCL